MNDNEAVDMESNRGSPENAEYGDTWRSTHVYECGICGTKTNRWVLGGYPSRGPRLLCPARDTEEHDELERLHERRLELEERVNLYGQDSEDDIVSGIRDELEVVRRVIDKTQTELGGKYNDIENAKDGLVTKRFNEP